MNNKNEHGRVVFSNIDIRKLKQTEDSEKMINDAFLEKEQIMRGQEQNIFNNCIEKPQIDVPRNYKKKRRKIKKRVKIAFTFLIILTFLITSMINYKKNFLDNPKIIIKNSLETLEKQISELVVTKEENILEKNNYSLEWNLSANLESDLAEEEYQNLFHNINRTKTSIFIQQDFENKKFFLNQIVKIDDQGVIDNKYLIEDSTKYYFVKDFLDIYINAGNNNYFETLSEDKTAYDNILYLYQFILSSIYKNTYEKDFTFKWVNTTIDGEEQKLRRVSIELDNDKIKTITNKVLKDLKEDKTSSNILNGIYDGFDSLKIEKDKIFLKEGEKISISFYTKGIFPTVKKCELIYNNSKDFYQLSYEIDKKQISLFINNTPQYTIQFRYEDYSLKGMIQNKNNIQIGSFEKMKNHFSFHIKSDDYDISIESVSKLKEKKKTSMEKTINVQIKKEEKKLVGGTIYIEFIEHNKVLIEEQVKDIIFESEISDIKKEEWKELLRNKWKLNGYIEGENKNENE